MFAVDGTLGFWSANSRTTLLSVRSNGTVTAERFVATAAESPANVIPVLAMVWIKPGTFIMGSRADELVRFPDEGPQTVVTLTKGFWMGVHEVTQGEYQTVMGADPSYFTSANGYSSDLNRPVEQVSWNDATNYCRLLTQKERAAGRLPAGWGYRLPTEAEWEYACRAGARTTRFSYGDDWSYAALRNYAWYDANSGNSTQPVEQKLANPWGLMDMHGNVSEWCQDRFGTYPGASVTDPQGPQGPGSGSDRVIRGGSWGGNGCGGICCRSAYRYHYYQGTAVNSLGFRVVLAPGQP